MAKRIPLHIINSLHLKYGDKYDYSMSAYSGHKGVISVMCNIHGFFEVPLNTHRYGSQACRQCLLYGNERPVDILKRESAKRHGDWYDYSSVEMKKLSDYVTIICPAHGKFLKSGSEHIKGGGCPKCAGFDFSNVTYVYLVQSDTRVKVGISQNPTKRLARLNTGSEIGWIIKTWPTGNYYAAGRVERIAHRELKDYHAGLSGFDGATEWFDTTPEYAIPIIEKIISQHA